MVEGFPSKEAITGFEIVEDSDLLDTSADDHSLYIMAPELGRNTDRFLFLVRRP